MKIYLVHGITRGLSEKILSVSKKRACSISELRKLGHVSAKAIDKRPKLRVAVGGENEILNFLEWKDIEIGKWHSCITIDPMLYEKSPLEILRNMD
ncbi:MAG: hypothetical protein CR967_02005 [Proteobacteria bacterium]|nr:MAG: hypothetical protein CR967_02005 [Pseudomonadota bacterium]